MNKMNKSFKQSLIAILLGACGMGCLMVSASETVERQVVVKIDKTNDSEALVDLKVDDFSDVFSLPDLTLGESRNITTQSGKAITISKDEKGLSLLVDGKTIALPGVGGNLAAHIQRSMPLHHDIQDSIQISGVDLDENQRQIIKNAFISAGIDKKIAFTKHKVMMFSTDGKDDVNKFIIKKGEHAHNWVNEDNSEIEVIIDSDEVKIHRIEIESQSNE